MSSCSVVTFHVCYDDGHDHDGGQSQLEMERKGVKRQVKSAAVDSQSQWVSCSYSFALQ